MLDFGTFNSFSLTDLRGIKQNKELIIKHTTETNKWGFLNVLLLLPIAIKQYAQNRQKHIIILQRDSFWHESHAVKCIIMYVHVQVCVICLITCWWLISYRFHIRLCSCKLGQNQAAYDMHVICKTYVKRIKRKKQI